MTTEQLQAGRELDALVADVMGQNPHWLGSGEDSVLSIGESGNPVPAYSTDIAAAFQVLDKIMGSKGIRLDFRRDSIKGFLANELPYSKMPAIGDWSATPMITGDCGELELDEDAAGTGETLPLAICRAALKSLAP